MNSRTQLVGRFAAVVAAIVLAASPTFAAGFGLFENGAKAMGMAGAFTAQADDPSALWHNAGGLAFFDKGAASLGFTYFTSTTADFRGANPFPGTGARGEQKPLSVVTPHGFWIRPINDQWKFGLGLYTPYGLVTEWKHPNEFPGRFLSTRAEIRAVDVNPTLGWKLGNFGIGVGVIGRFTDLELRRNIAQVNPFTLAAADVGKLTLSADMSDGYGWNLGVLHKFNNSFSWGASYRSKVKVNYTGDARATQVLTGYPQFDALLASRIPFNTKLPVKTSIEFPDMASLGFFIALGPTMGLEVDANWTGWSSFNEVAIDFTGDATHSLPDSTIPEHWEDVYNYRLGFRWDTGPASQWRAGYVYDESPQPEESVSPLLPDANRNGLTLGYGHKGRVTSDFALMYLKFAERSRHRSFAGEGAFFGTYNTTAWLLSATIGF
jgi:long-chain fatty acid transport protein